MAKIEVHCPICKQWKKIEIDENAAKNVKKGLLAINVPVGMICEHSFIAYVDKNLIVRDCFIADFQIDVPVTNNSQQITEENSFLESEANKFDLIKLNIPDILMAFIFRSIFLRQKVVVINDEDFLNKYILNFFNYVMENLFVINIVVLSSQEFEKDKENYNEYLVFKSKEIISDRSKLINPKKIDVEKSIAKKFLKENDIVSALIILRNEIQKIYEYSSNIAKLLKDSKDQTFTLKMIVDYISTKYNEKIHVSYVKFLLLIVKYYFEVGIDNVSGVSNLLGSL